MDMALTMQQLDEKSRQVLQTAEFIISILISFRESAQSIRSCGARFGKDFSQLVSAFEQTALEPKPAPVRYMRDLWGDKSTFDRVLRALHQNGFIEMDDFELVRRANPQVWIPDAYLEVTRLGEYKHALLWPYYTLVDSSPATCHLVVQKGQDEHGATAFFACPRLLVTAHHCIKDADFLSLMSYKDVKVPGPREWMVDPTADIAVVPLHGVEIPRALSLASEDPNVLDEIVTLGFPKISQRQPTLIAIRGTVISGPLQGYSGKETGTIAVSTVSSGGHSGGPVLGQRGKVVAMIVQRLESESTNLKNKQEFSVFYEAAPVSRIRKLLE
jgi:S1-C subfamily serine protease